MIPIIAFYDDNVDRTFTSIAVVAGDLLRTAHILVVELKRVAHFHYFERILSVDLHFVNHKLKPAFPDAKLTPVLR
jgi:hypothetical protein